MEQHDVRRGVCSKCVSMEVYRHPNGTQLSLRGGRAFVDTYFDTCLCLDCGYTEFYANLKGSGIDPNEIRANWKKAS